MTRYRSLEARAFVTATRVLLAAALTVLALAGCSSGGHHHGAMGARADAGAAGEVDEVGGVPSGGAGGANEGARGGSTGSTMGGSAGEVADTGGAAGSGTDGPPLSQPRLEITPAGLVLEPGKSATLHAQAFDASGAPMAVAVDWRGSSDAVTLTPGADNTVTITAGADLGSVQVVASASALQSAPATVAIASLVAGARLLDDDEILSSVLPTDDQQPGGPGSFFHAVIAGEAPSAGQVLVAEGKPFSGKVVSSTAAAGGHDVVIEVVPLDQLFAGLSIAQSYDPSRLSAVFPAGAPKSETLNADGSVTRAFELAVPDRTTPGAAPSAPNVLQSLRLENEFKLGPFSCGTEGSAKLSFSASMITAAVTPRLSSLDLDLSVGATGASMKVLADGFVDAHVTGPLRLNGELDGSFGCEAPIVQLLAPVPPPIAFVVWPGLVIGARFGGDGQILINLMELEIGSKLHVPMKMGFQIAPDGTFTNLSELDSSKIDADIQPKLQRTSGDSPLRLKAGLRAGMYAQAAVTNVPYLAWKLALGQYPYLSMLEAEGGLKAELTVGTIADQLNDPAYSSGYNIKLAFTLGLGGDLKTAFGWLSNLLQVVGPSAPELSYEHVLFSSPVSTAALTYLARYKDGETLPYLVKFDPQYATPELLGYYNIKRVDIYRKNGSGGAKLMAGREALGGETELTLSGKADAAGLNDPLQVAAFVEPVFGEGFSFKVQPVLGWVGITQVGGAADQVGRALTTDPTGNVAVVGYDFEAQGLVGSPSHGGGEANWMLFNPRGGAVYGTLTGSTGDDTPTDIARGADGSYYMVGTSLYGNLAGVGTSYAGFYAWLVKLDSLGKQIWAKQWVSAGYQQEIAHSVAIGPGGEIWVGGAAASNTLYGTTISVACSPSYELLEGQYDCGDVAVTRFDPAGNLVSHTVDEIPGYQTAGRIAVDPNTGDAVVAATTWADIETDALPGNHDSALDPSDPNYEKSGVGVWVFDAASGSVLSHKYIKIADANIDALDLAVDPSSTFIVVGQVDGSLDGAPFLGGGTDGYAMQLSGLELQGGTGNPTRVTTFASSGADFARAVRAASDGNVYVTGSTTGALYGPLAGGWDAWASKLTGTTPAWPGAGVQLGSSGDDNGSDIATDLYGNVFVTGDTNGALGVGVTKSFGGLDRFVAKLGPKGTLQ